MDLYTPQPYPTLFLGSPSPVPTQRILLSEGAMVSAPIEYALWFSKIGLKLTPPFVVLNIPPSAPLT